MEGCLMCGGPLVVLGRLGSLLHFRCRNCGCVQGCEIELEETDDEAELVADVDE